MREFVKNSYADICDGESVGKRRSCSLHGVEKDTVRHDGNTYRDFTVLHGIEKLQTKCFI